jgi:putative transposase
MLRPCLDTQRVSKKMRKTRQPVPRSQMKIPFAKFVEELPQFWQPRFYDFNVYSQKKKKEKLEYLHANPVTRGLVQHPKDWPWSSFLFYARDVPGLAPIDPVD